MSLPPDSHLETVQDEPQHPASRSAWPLMLWVAALSFVLAGLSEAGFGAPSDGAAPGWQGLCLSALALPLILGGGAAIGPLLCATPALEPSPLKLGLFSSVLSPAIVAGIWYGLCIGLELPPQHAWALTFVAVGLLALLGVRSRMSTASAGRAAGLACLVALVAGGGACVLAWSPDGLAARLGAAETIAQATFAQTLQDGAPVTNPWMSGLPLRLRPALASMLVAVSGPGQLSPLFAIGYWLAWCVFIVGIAGYLASAALFRETSSRNAGLRDLTSATGVVLVALALDGGRFGIHRWLSMALTMAFVVAGLHAVRRGARPWPGLAACLLLVLGLIHPWLAAALALALGAAAIVAGRWWVPSLAGLALLPGFFVARVYGGLSFEQSVPYEGMMSVPSALQGQLAALQARFTGPVGGTEVTYAESLALIVPMALGLALIVVLGFLGPRRSAESGALSDDGDDGSDATCRRACRLGTCFLSAMPLATLFVTWRLPVTSFVEAPDLLGAVLLVAALGLGRIVHLVRWGKPALAIAAALLLWMGQPAYRHLTQSKHGAAPFEEGPYGLEVAQVGPHQSGLRDALRFISLSPYSADPMTVLMRKPGPPGPVPRDEPVFMAPLLTGLPVWGGRAAPPGTHQSPALAPPRGELRTSLGDLPKDRRDLLNALYEYEGKWHHRFGRVLRKAQEIGHTFVFVVTEADRRATSDRGVGPRGVDDAIRRLGTEVIFQQEDVTVYVTRTKE